MSSYRTLTVERQGQVATVSFLTRALPGAGERPDGHVELAEALTDLRQDHTVRVVIMTGAGRNFKVPAGADLYHDPERQLEGTDPARAWRNFSAIIRCHQTLAEMEKPVIAKVNGDAV